MNRAPRHSAILVLVIWLTLGGSVLARAERSNHDPSPEPVDRINFDTGSADLSDDAKRSLDALVDVVADDPTSTVTLVGHADRRGDPRANLRLSRRRAQSVRRYLVERGINPTRIRVRAVGASHPLDGGRGAEAAARNRRVDLFLVRGADPGSKPTSDSSQVGSTTETPKEER